MPSHSNINAQRGVAHRRCLAGWPEKAPFDVVIYTGPVEEITESLRLQVLPVAELFASIGHGPVMQGELHRFNHHNQWSVEIIFENLFTIINSSP